MLGLQIRIHLIKMESLLKRIGTRKLCLLQVTKN